MVGGSGGTKSVITVKCSPNLCCMFSSPISWFALSRVCPHQRNLRWDPLQLLPSSHQVVVAVFSVSHKSGSRQQAENNSLLPALPPTSAHAHKTPQSSPQRPKSFYRDAAVSFDRSWSVESNTRPFGEKQAAFMFSLSISRQTFTPSQGGVFYCSSSTPVHLQPVAVLLPVIRQGVHLLQNPAAVFVAPSAGIRQALALLLIDRETRLHLTFRRFRCRTHRQSIRCTEDGIVVESGYDLHLLHGSILWTRLLHGASRAVCLLRKQRTIVC